MQIDPSRLLPISRRTVAANLPSAVDIYILAADESVPELFCTAGKTPGVDRTGELATRRDIRLYIRAGQRSAYQQYLRDNWYDLVIAPPGRSCEKVGVLGDIVLSILSDVFRGGDTDEIVEASRELAENICDVLEGQTAQASELYDVLLHDYRVFTHSTNVALYCVMLARELGYSSAEQRKIALGGLLHDIGKLEIDENLLTNTGQLTRLQYREIMQHPILGFRRLANRNDVSFEQLMMVYQHHERIDGSGYPTSVTVDEIHPWARICAIADAYEALTTGRPYRPSLAPEQAIDVLADADGALDREMLECWEKLICQTV